MKTKQLLRFYFYADEAERAIDNLITYVACLPFGYGGAERTAEKIIYLRDCKDRLSELWLYLDGVVSCLGTEREVLFLYVSGGDCDVKRLRRVLMRFRRHSTGAVRFTEALALLKKYAVFCRPG